MDTNRIEGIGHQIKGTLKEKFGKLIGDAKLTADGAAERATGGKQTSDGAPFIAGIDTDRIVGVGHQIKGATEQAFGRLVGDSKLMADGAAERLAGKVQNAAGSARDEAREADKAEAAAASTAGIGSKHDEPQA